MSRVALLGGGSWGTTLALVLKDNGHQVVVWEFDAEQAEEVKRARGVVLRSLVDEVPLDVLFEEERAELVHFLRLALHHVAMRQPRAADEAWRLAEVTVIVPVAGK